MFKPEDFAKSGFNFALFFAKTTFDGVERMALLNLAACAFGFRNLVMSNMTALLGVKDVQFFRQAAKGTGQLRRSRRAC